LLYKISFADVLDEGSGAGYQRRFSRDHSLEFRRYIQKPGSATISLTFNLRPSATNAWQVKSSGGGLALLSLSTSGGPLLAQVDCQHRLGHLADLDVSLPFMTFVGLTVEEEMRIFSIINGKAKGLSSSLLDLHEAKMSQDLAQTKPELFIALRLNDDSASPWFQRLDLGGNNTVGLHRYASLRTMQKAIKRFLRESNALKTVDAQNTANVVIAFWQAVSELLKREWSEPRKHLLTKGIGVYSLMSLAGDLVSDAGRRNLDCDRNYFISALSDFIFDIDWSSHGPLRGFGGTLGADQALEHIRSIKAKRQLRVVTNG
jgi:DGQHR domain-containing protein